jgi:phosphatidylinositol glycan class B
VDHLFFGGWPLTTYQFLRQNVLQGISVYYGVMSWHYYILQALPQLLWTLLPFTLMGASRVHLSAPLKQLRSCVAVVLTTFSFLQHKEVRFVQPLLPILHLFAAEGLSRVRSRSIRFALILTHLLPAVYLLLYHAKAQISAMQYLRQADVESVAFLMPCHSTPWQSHMHRPDLELPGLDGSGASGEGGYLWFIACEPPVLCVVYWARLQLIKSRRGQNASTYQDQSAVFYADPLQYLESRFPAKVDVSFPPSPALLPSSVEAPIFSHEWPSHLAVFEHLLRQADGKVGALLGSKGYEEVWREWNSHWHDDARRTGDVIVLAHQAVTHARSGG